MKAVGLVNPEYFIFMDDSEHSLRLKKYGEIVCVPRLKIVHDCAIADPNAKFTPWKEYYLFRNNLLLLLKHYPLRGLNYLRINFMRLYVERCFEPHLVEVRKRALWDAVFHRLGKSKIYHP